MGCYKSSPVAALCVRVRGHDRVEGGVREVPELDTPVPGYRGEDRGARRGPRHVVDHVPEIHRPQGVERGRLPLFPQAHRPIGAVVVDRREARGRISQKKEERVNTSKSTGVARCLLRVEGGEKERGAGVRGRQEGGGAAETRRAGVQITRYCSQRG